jgi:hypothetical protein
MVGVKIHNVRAALPFLALSVLLAAIPGCRKIHRTDFKPLDEVGFSYSREEELRALDITDAEVAELVKAKRVGLSDESCVELIRIARGRQQPFTDGDDIGALRQAGVAEPAILELVRLNQLGLQTGEEQAMRLAGLSDSIILELARRRAEGKLALSGPSLATLKNAGVSEATMHELLRRGVPDSQLSAIVDLKRRGAGDAAVLSRFPGS